MGAAAIPLALGAVGTVIGAYGQYQQGQAASDAAKYQAQVARNNAVLAERSAKDAIDRGAVAESQTRLRTRLLLGSQRAAFASRGIDLGSATVADVAAGTAGVGELDALTERSNAQREAQGFRIEGTNYRSQSDLLKSQAQGARTGAALGAAGTLLSGASSVAGKWYNYRQIGAL